jgi:hypothetical protein
MRWYGDNLQRLGIDVRLQYQLKVEDEITKQAVLKTLILAEGVRKTRRRPKAIKTVCIYQQIMAKA